MSAESSGTDDRCWRLAVRRVREMTGNELPEEWARALVSPCPFADLVPAGLACRRGDVIECRGVGKTRSHVAVCLDAFNAEHFAGDGAESSIVSIAALRRAGVIVRIMRPRGKEWRS